MTRQPPPPSRRIGLRWWVGRHRRALAAASTGLAIGCSLLALHPQGATQAHRDVHVAALTRDGATLRPGATPVAGRSSLPTPTPVTVAPTLTPPVAGAGLVVTTIRLADPGATAVLHVGDRIDVLAVPRTEPGPGADDSVHGAATVLAHGLVVAGLPTPQGTDDPGGLVALTTTPSVAATLAHAAGAQLSVTVG